MNDEEKAKELSAEYKQYTHNNAINLHLENTTKEDVVEQCVRAAALEMAEWKDKQFQEEKKKWLDKACMWIEYKYIKNSGGHYSMYRKENIIKSFKQAMEE